MDGRRLLLFSTDQRGPGTICGGIRIVTEALNRLPELCVLAITDADGVGGWMPDGRFDHIRLPKREPGNPGSLALRSVVIGTALSTFQPDILIALRSIGAERELLDPLMAERHRRPQLRTALALWDLPQPTEIQALSTETDVVHESFDEFWSFGDPMVHDNRYHLTPTAADDLVDLGYLTTASRRAPTGPCNESRPHVAISLGSGWLSRDALGALRAALRRPGFRGASVELLSNEVLGRDRAATLAEQLGIGLHRNGRNGGPPSQTSLLVSTGGYNSVCAALRSPAPTVIVHDSGSSTAGQRASALAGLDLCDCIDLRTSEPADIEHGLLSAVARRRSPTEVLSGGAAAALKRILGFLHGPTGELVGAYA